MDQKLSELLQQDIIEGPLEGTHGWVSPTVAILKDNGEIRLCNDMRMANKAIIREKYPLPTIEDLLPLLGRAKIFSKLDVKQAYHQVEIAPESRDVTTFITKRGLFRYKRLVFGISSAPEIFQRIFEQILSGCEGVFNFLDDILIWGESREEHDPRVANVLHKLQSFDVLLNEGKCLYGVAKVDFIGHELSAEGVRPAKSKRFAVMNFRAPKNVDELSSFLGLINYVGKFIPNLATVTENLRELKSQQNFEWNEKHTIEFEALKKALASDTVLGYYDPEARTQLIADASPVGMGAVLIQFSPNGPRIISFASKVLSPAQRRYCQTEKEALALVWGVEKFAFYLYGKEFELITDHKALEIIFGPRARPCARIERWVLRLQTFQFKVIYKPGKSNIADPFSRLLREEDDEPPFDEEAEQYINRLVEAAVPSALSIREVEQASSQDETLQRVKVAIESQDWSEIPDYAVFKMELCVTGDIVLRGCRIVMPTKLRELVLELAHEGHPGISGMKAKLRTKVWWPGMDSEVVKWVKKCHGCQLMTLPNAPEPMQRKKLPSQPWVDLAVDYMGPLPSGESILVVVDYFSRFIDVRVLQNQTKEGTVKELDELFDLFGYPMTLTSDNGPCFRSAEFSQFCTSRNIQHRKTTPYWPPQNGEVERQNRSLLKRMRISDSEGTDWKEDLKTYVKSYHKTPHRITGKTPFFLMFGREMRDEIPVIMDIEDRWEEVRDRDAVEKEKGKEYGDRKRRATECGIEEGDTVLTKNLHKRNKLATNFLPTPHLVLERTGGDVLVQNSQTGETYNRNVSHVKKLVQAGNLEEPIPAHGDDFEVSDLEISNPETPSPVPEALSPDPVVSSMSPVLGTPAGGSASQTGEESTISLADIPSTSSAATTSRTLVPVGDSRPKRIRRPPTHLQDYVQQVQENQREM